jgi:transporter family protein
MREQILLVLTAIIFWGLWGFFSKLASTRIGVQTAFFSSLSIFILIIGYLFFVNQLLPFKPNSSGILFALLAGICSAVASIVFYIILGKNPAGITVATTALYPIITLALSMVFLREGITPIKATGFILAIIALFLLNL